MAQRAGATLDSAESATVTEPFRRELLAHCYRMPGSADEAQDLVQETCLRAWRSHGGFEGRPPVRTWLYQSAASACLTAVQRRARRRPLPSGLAGPGGDPPAPAGAGREIAWLQPVPDALVTPESGDPAAVAVSRESPRLALIASLRYLPPRQRAVLILQEVPGFPAAEAAGTPGMTTTAVKSALHRARARPGQALPAAGQLTEPAGPRVRALLQGYIAAFENSGPEALKRLLRRDAMLELPPSPAWFTGSEAITHAVAGLGSRSDWRMPPTAANGQPAAAACLRGADGAYRAYAIMALTATTTGIARLIVFGDTGLFPVFGFPPALPPAPAAAASR